MGIPSIEDATLHLVKAGVCADIGNPGGVMPHLTRPLVAVNLLDSTMTERTMIANICAPQSMGRNTCENLAALVAYYWKELGAQCQWGDYQFDNKAAMHIVKVTGVWTQEEAAQEV